MKKHGFTLVEIMIVVALIGILAAIAIPSFMRIRAESRKNICRNAQRTIRDAIDEWTLQSGAAEGSAITPGDTNILTYFKKSSMPICPEGNVTFAFPARVGQVVICPAHIASHGQ